MCKKVAEMCDIYIDAEEEGLKMLRKRDAPNSLVMRLSHDRQISDQENFIETLKELKTDLLSECGCKPPKKSYDSEEVSDGTN